MEAAASHVASNATEPAGLRGAKVQKPKKAAAAAAAAAAVAKPEPKIRKPHRFRPGTVARRTIIKQQGAASVVSALPYAPVYRFVRDLVHEHNAEFRLSPLAVCALREATESMIVKLFSATDMLASSAGRQTYKKGDLERVQVIGDLVGGKNLLGNGAITRPLSKD